MKEIRWVGRGGQGSFTAAKILGMAASVYGGKFAQAFPSFGPERRGAPVLGFTRISDRKITDRSEVSSCDYVVVLDETLWGPLVTADLRSESIILINTSTPEKYLTQLENPVICLDATKLALDVLGLPITNTAMLGALIAVSALVEIEHTCQAIEASLSPHIAAKNIALVKTAYKTIKEELKHE